MPVDTISTLEKGMPINSLVHHGFKTIYDIRNESIEDLRMIDDIGPVSAQAIFEATSKIITSVYKEATPKINPYHLSTDDLALLESIYRKWKLTDAVQVLKEAIETLSQQVGTDIQIAKRKKGFLGGLFQSRAEKEHVELTLRELNQEAHQATLRKVKKQLIHIHQFAVDQEQLKKHFIEKNAAYYTEIEKVIGFDATAIAEDLPNEIIEEIQAFPLDTTGLKVDLRYYQTFGAKYALYYKRTLLGDEMGLGKTIQALALINHLFQNDGGYSIVVCPLSVLVNWKREIHQHSNLNAFIFHGNQRASAFTKWQEEKSQITAGGVGLNIQAANIVILCEPQWKPSIEEQAISRAYRMGQSRNVVVYRLLTEDSIDVSMLELLGQNAGLFDLYARESEVGSLALNDYGEGEDESLKQKVLQLEKERLKEKVG
ncbi:SNF2-related protein [Sporosarcina jiandibaonis]|uniref:SNF2-related protein n=1 Tax=Sporosarcina jiandibaonis TaxID=2715535 RepID=UPI001555110E|nr:SNF2-related protein [Sporosarcina jiandibaonis]